MADITRRIFLRQLRGTPTTHITHLVGGRVRHQGTGLTFWFRSITAVLSEVPVDDRELPLLFHARTSDFQDISVQATVTYRITRPDTAATRLDFSIDPISGAWRGTQPPTGRHRGGRRGAARLDASASVPLATLYALAAREFAAQLPEIGQLTVTPDLVTGVLTRRAVASADGREPA